MKATVVAVILAALADGAVTGDRVEATRQPRAPKHNGKSFTLNQIENKNFKGHDGPMSLIRAHMKYAQKLPDHLSKALEIDIDLRIKFGALSQGNWPNPCTTAQDNRTNQHGRWAKGNSSSKASPRSRLRIRRHS